MACVSADSHPMLMPTPTPAPMLYARCSAPQPLTRGPLSSSCVHLRGALGTLSPSKDVTEADVKLKRTTLLGVHRIMGSCGLYTPVVTKLSAPARRSVHEVPVLREAAGCEPGRRVSVGRGEPSGPQPELDELEHVLDVRRR